MPLCSLLPSAVVVLARGLNGCLNTTKPPKTPPKHYYHHHENTKTRKWKKIPQKDLDPSNRVFGALGMIPMDFRRSLKGGWKWHASGTTLNERCWTKLPCVQGSFIQCSFSDKDISWHTLGYIALFRIPLAPLSLVDSTCNPLKV